jgi:hypothetical protein
MSGVVRGIAVAPTVGVERYAVLDDVALADRAVESKVGTPMISSRRPEWPWKLMVKPATVKASIELRWWTSTRWKSPASSFRSH